MRIAMISTEAGSGGAARAMQRLARGLRGRGHVVDVFVAGEAVGPDGEIRVLPREGDPAADRFVAIGALSLDRDYVAARRTAVSNTSFSTQIAGFDLASLPLLRSYDAVNVHWTGGMMSPVTLGNLIDLGIPTVFTLHDMAHFTGGCHYSAGCRSYEADCEPCHQVSRDELGLIRHGLETKRARYGRRNVHAAAPSAWLAGKADASRVFGAPVHAISNGLETDVFRLRDRRAIRQEWGLDDETRAILFGVFDNGERRKGYDELVGVLKRCREHPSFAERARSGRIRFMTFGKSQVDLQEIGVPFIDLGWIGDDERLSAVYNAADLCILPSHEDNQPNVMLEAMACGTPVIAFRIGGIPETIVDGETGCLIEPFDLDAMAKAAIALIEDRGRATRMGQAAATAVQRLTLDRQAQAYEDVFRRLLSETGWKAAPAGGGGIILGENGARSVRAPFILDPIVASKPIGPVLADQIDALTKDLAAVRANRDTVHEQLVRVSADYGALQKDFAKVNTELQFLKAKLTNRLLLKVRAAFRSRTPG